MPLIGQPLTVDQLINIKPAQANGSERPFVCCGLFHFKNMELLINGGDQRMTSREIAAYTGKRHADTLRDIRRLEPDYITVYGAERKFALSDYKDSTGRNLQEYSLDKSQALFIASSYNPIVRAKIQKRWEDLENEKPHLPNFKDPAEAAIAWANEYKAKQIAEAKIKEDKPKVEFADTVRASDTDYQLNVLPNLLGIGQNILYALLREKQVLKLNNKPKQEYISRGLFRVAIEPFIDNKGKMRTNEKVFVTAKGIVWIQSNLKRLEAI